MRKRNKNVVENPESKTASGRAQGKDVEEALQKRHQKTTRNAAPTRKKKTKNRRRSVNERKTWVDAGKSRRTKGFEEITRDGGNTWCRKKSKKKRADR